MPNGSGYRTPQSKAFHTLLCGAAFAPNLPDFNLANRKLMSFLAAAQQVSEPEFILEVPGEAEVAGKTGNHSTHVLDSITLPFKEDIPQDVARPKAFMILTAITDFIKRRIADGKFTDDQYMDILSRDNDHGFTPVIEGVISKNMMVLEFLASEFKRVSPARYSQALVFNKNGFSPLIEAMITAAKKSGKDSNKFA